MPFIQNLYIKGGADKTATLYARDDSNAPLSLSGATISMRVGRPPASISSDWSLLTLTGTIVSAALGSFTVAFTPSATQYLCGDYWQECWITTSAALVVGTEGRLRIENHLAT